MTRTTVLATVLAVVAAGITAVIITPTAAQAAIICDQALGGNAFYPGDSASKKYNDRFSQGPASRGLGTHVPQGLGYWSDGDRLLMGAYAPSGANARIYSMTTGGTPNGEVEIYPTHAGGVAVAGSYLYVSGSATSIRRYRLSDLKTKLGEAGIPYLAQAGSQEIPGGASFVSSYNGAIWAGTFNETGRGKMFEYKVNGDGSLTRVGTVWEIPTKTQGLTVTANHFIYSTSYGRNNKSNIYVVRRGDHNLDTAKVSCFRAPSMSEGIVAVGNTAYVVYESGASYYADASDKPLNIIKNLHKASVSSLTGLAP